MHHAVDDHSRYAYSEILSDETKTTATAFTTRAITHLASIGVTITRVLTDNGSCYRSGDFAQVLSDNGIRHKRTRPCRPQTNGEVERFNRTLSEEWAYARTYTSEQERLDAYPDFLHTYNHHPGHTALGGAPPAHRAPNPAGQNTYGVVGPGANAAVAEFGHRRVQVLVGRRMGRRTGCWVGPTWSRR